MQYTIDGKTPDIRGALFLAPTATISGDVVLGEDASVWFSTVIRGDMAFIRIGRGTNIQDGAVVHVDKNMPTSIGEYVTVGHGAIVHGCTVASGVLIGMGSCILNGAEIGEFSIVGAGALVPQGKKFPPRSILIGSPAKLIREVSDEEIRGIRENAERYIENARKYSARVTTESEGRPVSNR